MAQVNEPGRPMGMDKKKPAAPAEKTVKVRVSVQAREGFNGAFGAGMFFPTGTGDYDVPESKVAGLVKRQNLVAVVIDQAAAAPVDGETPAPDAPPAGDDTPPPPPPPGKPLKR